MKILRWLDDNFEKVLLCTALVLISVLMFSQIIMRNILRHSIPWSDEACRYLFVWCGGLGISYATKNGAHLRMDILPTLMPSLAKPLNILADLALAAVAVTLIWGSLPFMANLERTGQLSATLRMPMKYLYASMLVGFGLTLIRLFQRYLLMIAGAVSKNRGDAK